ncbi:MAG: hypothetical protein R3F53_00570 [Gammaproteobacteria bacterium]
MSIQVLQEMLLSVQVEKKTGHVVVLGKAENGFSRIGKLVLKEGEIVGANLQSDSGLKAVTDILALDITQVRFLPMPDVLASLESGTPSVADIVRQINAVDVLQTISGDLQEETTKVLEKLVGTSASQKVEAIARKNPPNKHPKEFLDQCKAFVELMSGKSKAEQHFAPLYEKINLG